MISRFYRYRFIFSVLLLPVIIYSGIQITNSENRYYKNEAAFTEALAFINITGKLTSGEKKNTSENLTSSVQSFTAVKTEVIRSLKFKELFYRESETNFRLYPFLTSHFATST